MARPWSSRGTATQVCVCQKSWLNTFPVRCSINESLLESQSYEVGQWPDLLFRENGSLRFEIVFVNR